MKTDAVIFDFDDTLVITNAVYDEAKTDFFAALKQMGFGYEAQWATYLNEADIRQIHCCGYLSHRCFPLALRETYEHFSRLSGIAPSEETALELEQLGWRIHDETPVLMEGAKELLATLSGKVRLFLLTQGDEATQFLRLKASQLLSYFNAYQIVPVKNVATYQKLIAVNGIACERSWMIGNSIRADINPAINVGLQPVLLDVSAWSYDRVEPEGDYHTIHRLLDFLHLV